MRLSGIIYEKERRFSANSERKFQIDICGHSLWVHVCICMSHTLICVGLYVCAFICVSVFPRAPVCFVLVLSCACMFMYFYIAIATRRHSMLVFYDIHPSFGYGSDYDLEFELGKLTG